VISGGEVVVLVCVSVGCLVSIYRRCGCGYLVTLSFMCVYDVS
jgi:hypothetical protein